MTSQEIKSVSKEEVINMCRELEKVASSENNEHTVICHFTSSNRVWVDQENLDWLADEIGESSAKKLRDIMYFGIDFQGGYYYYDF